MDALTTSTDGWVAALQLATLSLRGDDDAASLLGRMSGRNDIIGEFLAENVLDTLEPEMLEFLLLTSITERTCGGLASALAKVARGQAMLEEVERRGLFLQHIDDDRNWFRYHHMFAEFLRRRLERDRPEQIEQLHRTASAWFAENGCLNEAVDHALAAGDPARAVDLVEQDETYLIERSKMTTLLGIVKKLPPQLVVARAPLQLIIAWANILLQRPAPTYAALDRFEAAVERTDLSEAARADMRAEANVVRSIAEIFGDRVDDVDALVAEALSRPDTLPPRVAGVAGNVAAFAAIYRFDFETARQYLDFAAPYHEMMGPFAAIYGSCYAGIAAKYQLDIPAAMDAFRQAYQMAVKVGPHSHAVRLAGALLGELLYETGELTEATRLLDESYALGSEGGGVDYMAARYVTGALIKAAEGDRASAADRLTDGMRAAENLGLPRLAARINNERIRLGIPISPADAARLRSPRTIPHDNGIATSQRNSTKIPACGCCRPAIPRPNAPRPASGRANWSPESTVTSGRGPPCARSCCSPKHGCRRAGGRGRGRSEAGRGAVHRTRSVTPAGRRGPGVAVRRTRSRQSATRIRSDQGHSSDAVRPPSTTNAPPVQKRDRSDARNTVRRAMSSRVT